MSSNQNIEQKSTETFEIQMSHEGTDGWIDAFRNIDTLDTAHTIVDDYPEEKGNLRIVRTTVTREVVG